MRSGTKHLLGTEFIALIIFQNLFSQDFRIINNADHNQFTRSSDTSETGNNVHQPVSSDFEVFPILSYDTDTGFGYGLKTFLLNFLGMKESFDLILFHSTKGEGW